MKKTKLKRYARHRVDDTSPVKLLESELNGLRRDLRATIRAYAARLEIELAESTAALASAGPAEKLSREQLHEIRELMILAQNRKLKPQKGRRKDVRKLDSIIGDLHSSTHPHPSR